MEDTDYSEKLMLKVLALRDAAYDTGWYAGTIEALERDGMNGDVYRGLQDDAIKRRDAIIFEIRAIVEGAR